MIQNVMTALEKMNLVDRFLFDETLEEPEAYQAVVSILLENEIELLDKTQTEKELRISPELRTVRLDVVGMGKDHTVYYTEMQKQDTRNLEKRSRYYQGQMDVSLLEPGEADFNRLNDTCFIMVAPFDIFGRGLYRYTFEGVCRECPDLKIQDGALRIFINTKGTNRENFSQEFLDFMEYITASTDETAEKSNSNKIKKIHESVTKVKKSEKMGVKCMQRWEELVLSREEGREQGLQQGLQQGIAQGTQQGLLLTLVSQVCRKLQKGQNVLQIAEALEESEERIEKICEAAQKYAPDYDVEKIVRELMAKEE